MATLFPEAAIRPSLPAEPLRDVDMEENVSDYVSVTAPDQQNSPDLHSLYILLFVGRLAYSVLNQIMRPRIVVDVHRHAAQGRHLG